MGATCEEVFSCDGVSSSLSLFPWEIFPFFAVIWSVFSQSCSFLSCSCSGLFLSFSLWGSRRPTAALKIISANIYLLVCSYGKRLGNCSVEEDMECPSLRSSGRKEKQRNTQHTPCDGQVACWIVFLILASPISPETIHPINLVLIPQGAADVLYCLLFPEQPQSTTEVFNEIFSSSDISCSVE